MFRSSKLLQRCCLTKKAKKNKQKKVSVFQNTTQKQKSFMTFLSNATLFYHYHLSIQYQ